MDSGERRRPQAEIVPPMESYARLQAMTDEQLIAAHDEISIHSAGGSGFYLEELRRRDQVRSDRRVVVLTFANAALAVVAVAVSVLSLFLR